MSAASTPTPLSENIRSVRESLLTLHKSLIDLVRDERQTLLGRTIAPGELLQLLTSDPAFDWLHPFSQLIVAIDQMLERESPPEEQDGKAVRVESERLLATGGQHFKDALFRSASVTHEQARLEAALGSLPASEASEHDALLQRRAVWIAPRRRPNSN